jgi:hypothetical protein
MARWADGFAEYMVQVSRPTAKNKETGTEAAVNPDSATGVLSQFMMSKFNGNPLKKKLGLQSVRRF